MKTTNLLSQLLRFRYHSKRAFTLVEIMIVLAIIMVLIGFAVQRLGGIGETAKIARAQADIGNITGAVRLYESMNLQPPSTSEGLQALVSKPASAKRWNQMMDSVPLDPWGNEYQYRFPGKHKTKSFDLYSKGPDRIENTEDDIGNWQDF